MHEHVSELTGSGQKRGVPAIGKLDHIGSDALTRRATLPTSAYDTILSSHEITAGYVGPRRERACLGDRRCGLPTQARGCPRCVCTSAVVVEIAGSQHRIDRAEAIPVVNVGEVWMDDLGVGLKLRGQAAAGLWQESCNENQPPYSPSLGHQWDGQTSGGVADQHDVLAAVCNGCPHHICVARAAGVKRLARQVHCDSAVSPRLQFGDQSIPAPGAMPVTMDQAECAHNGFLLNRLARAPTALRRPAPWPGTGRHRGGGQSRLRPAPTRSVGLPARWGSRWRPRRRGPRRTACTGRPRSTRRRRRGNRPARRGPRPPESSRSGRRRPPGRS